VCAILTCGERNTILELLKTVRGGGETAAKEAIEGLDLKLRPLNKREKDDILALAEGRTLTVTEVLKTLLKEEDG